jgi:hypothetical protein
LNWSSIEVDDGRGARRLFLSQTTRLHDSVIVDHHRRCMDLTCRKQDWHTWRTRMLRSKFSGRGELQPLSSRKSFRFAGAVAMQVSSGRRNVRLKSVIRIHQTAACLSSPDDRVEGDVANHSIRSNNQMGCAQPARQTAGGSSHGTLVMEPSTSVAPLENVLSPRCSVCPSRQTHRKGSEKVQRF